MDAVMPEVAIMTPCPAQSRSQGQTPAGGPKTALLTKWLFSSLLALLGCPSGESSGLAASFNNKRGHPFQLISIPGRWDGIAEGQGITAQLWLQLVEPHGYRAPIFAYGVRQPLNYTVQPKELGLRISRDPLRGGTSRVEWVYKGRPLVLGSEVTVTPGEFGPGPANGRGTAPPGLPDPVPLDDMQPRPVGDPGTSNRTANDPRGPAGSAAQESDASQAPVGEMIRGLDLYQGGWWHHITATLDFASGSYAYYVNGTLLLSAKSGQQGTPAPGGEFVVGAELSYSSTDSTQWSIGYLTSAIFDEFRVYNRALSQEEVEMGVSALQVGSAKDSLILHWKFDEPISEWEADFSGHGNDGLRGAVPDLSFPDVASFVDEDTSFTILSKVTSPDIVMSSSPSQNVWDMVALAVRDHPANLWMPSETGKLITQPQVGRLTYASGEAILPGESFWAATILYHPPDEWPPSSEHLPVTFVLETGNQERIAKVYPTETCLPMASTAPHILAERSKLILSLGGTCKDGSRVAVEIIERPAIGRLFHATGIGISALAEETAGQLLGKILVDYDDADPLNDVSSGLVLEEITTYPAMLNDGFASVVYWAPGHQSEARAEIVFRWIGPYADSSVSASATILILPQDNPPLMLEPIAIVSPDQSVDLQLRASNDGLPLLGSDSRIIFEVIRGPRFGSLMQVSNARERSKDMLDRFGMQTPTVSHYASQIPEYTPEHGPAWTSQQTYCTPCCWDHKTCNRKDCEEVGVDFDFCRAQDLVASSTIEKVLGDDMHIYNFKTEVYRPNCTGCGRHWFVIGLEEPVFVDEILVYEDGVHGSIVSISAAAEYRGAATVWRQMTAMPHLGRAEYIPGLIETELPACPDPADPYQWFRIEYDTDIFKDSVGFDAFKVRGSLMPSKHAVWNPDGWLWYKPDDGIFLIGENVTETIEVVASDCVNWSNSLVVTIPRDTTAKTGNATLTFGTVEEIKLPVGVKTLVEVDLSEAARHLARVLELKSHDDFAIQVHPPMDDQLEFFHEDLTLIDIQPSRTLTNRYGDGVELTSSKPRLFIQPRSSNFTRHLLRFSAVSHQLEYSLAVELVGVCPADSLPTECAYHADVCSKSDAELVFDPSNRVCVSMATASAFNFPYGMVVPLILVVLFCLIGYLIFRKCLTTRLRASGPPRQGEKVTLVTTDIHGSTTLWDTFPEEMARDIALHHECMRASLKECNGYEIATEGDSFKCAFRTPEDAVCWSILVQLDLLCAPWTSPLEDGGHSVLKIQKSWANIEKTTLAGSHGVGILNDLISQDLLENERKALKDGALCSTVFNAAKAASTPFSQQFAEQQGAEKSCVHTSARNKLIPVFRGLRVRIGIHTGIAEQVDMHEMTKRFVYGGMVADIAKAVSDAPCGGQIIMTGETLAEISSMQDLAAMVAQRCAGWRHGEALDDPYTPASFGVLSLGSHIIKQPVIVAASEAPDAAPSGAGQVEEGRSVLIEVKEPFSGHDCSNRSIDLQSDQCVESVDETILPRVGVAARLKDIRGGGSLASKHLSAAGNFARSVTGFAMDSLNPSNARKSFGSGSYVPRRSEETVRKDTRSMVEFSYSHELIMVLPWPLKARAMHFPSPSSKKSLTPSWDMAPSSKRVTILFTFIQDWSNLKSWSAAQDSGALADDLKKLQAQVRYQLQEHNGYEVEGEQGNFVCAFHTAADAVKFSVVIQEGLLHVNWSEELLRSKWGYEQRTGDGEVSFRGLRLSIGMCTGNALRMQPCIRTGRMEYYGPIMNHAARVATAAHGGQVLMHEASWKEIVSGDGSEIADVLFANMGKHQLKGISKLVFITQAMPKSIKNRAFPPIKTVSNNAGAAPATEVAAMGMELEEYLVGVGAIRAEGAGRLRSPGSKGKAREGSGLVPTLLSFKGKIAFAGKNISTGLKIAGLDRVMSKMGLTGRDTPGGRRSSGSRKSMLHIVNKEVKMTRSQLPDDDGEQSPQRSASVAWGA